MNAVEIEEAVSKLAELPFDPMGFPFAFLEAFGNKPTTIQRLKSGNTNQSDLPGGVLQRNNIHLKVCAEGQVTDTLAALRDSAATTKHKAKFILATDGVEFQAESLEGEGETVACAYADLANHFGFFLPLAGISTVRQDSRERLRHPRHEPAEQTLHRAAEAQPGLGHRSAPAGDEPFHGPADLLLLCRRHLHLS